LDWQGKKAGVDWIDIVAVDISGRHAERGRYLMVCAVVFARVSPAFLEKIYSVRLMPRLAEAVDLNTVADLTSAAVQGLPGILIAEPGDFYNLEIWRVKSVLRREFKHPETLAERTAIELAHHISVAGRRLIKDMESNEGADEAKIELEDDPKDNSKDDLG
jgi:hypothetical protein